MLRIDPVRDGLAAISFEKPLDKIGLGGLECLCFIITQTNALYLHDLLAHGLRQFRGDGDMLAFMTVEFDHEAVPFLFCRFGHFPGGEFGQFDGRLYLHRHALHADTGLDLTTWKALSTTDFRNPVIVDDDGGRRQRRDPLAVIGIFRPFFNTLAQTSYNVFPDTEYVLILGDETVILFGI